MKRLVNTWRTALKVPFDPAFKAGMRAGERELQKSPLRTEIINFLLAQVPGDTHYLEIGVANPDRNFNHIQATYKYSVDPGFEYLANPVDFQLTSDVFFQQYAAGQILEEVAGFDVIFIDGGHLAAQVDRDITNALQHLKEGGLLVMHDCNPPTAWHARESYADRLTAARGQWNGTTWKAFLKWRTMKHVSCCCVDTDWGIGVISQSHQLGPALQEDANPFYEYHLLEAQRKEHLNLVSFEELKKLLRA
ncbi:MAG: class I SAM-dependent methyltransferase [Saprospiraceae bacterium]|nr:class I SAM-dependent methyltransferase [Saprospiraceae bacterium]